MRIEKRTMGWYQKPSAYNYNQQLNAKRKETAQAFMNQQSILSGAIFGAQDTMSQGMTEITLKAVLSRIQDKAKTQLDDVSSLATSFRKTV